MKKRLRFFRSMTFGMILLGAVVVLCLAGSLLPQHRPAEEYAVRYGQQLAEVVLGLGLDHVFTTPVFIVLAAMLCLNLAACSIAGLPKVGKARAAFKERAARETLETPLTPTQRQALDRLLRRKRLRVVEKEGRTLYIGRQAGFYGSFCMHLSILVVLAVGVATLVGATVIDRSVMPGESELLADGTRVYVDSFRIEDETGRLDYASVVRVALPSGTESEPTLVRVNEPLRFGDYKIYQQTYGTAGRISVTNEETGGSDTLTLTSPSFLTLDGRNGLYYQALYPGYVMDENGGVTLISSTSGAYPDPVYEVFYMNDGQSTPMLGFPGEEVRIGAVTYRFEAPMEYPGLRIKRMPAVLMGLLYAAFGLMVAALGLCFFWLPVCVAVESDRYGIFSPKAQPGLILALEAALGTDTKEA